MTVDTQSLRAYDPARPAPWRGCSSANTTSRGAVTEAMSDQSSTIDSTSPVRVIPSDASQPGPQPGGGLCLSGGGYRAMVFHAGVLWRLNQAGYVRKLDRISSVSGGSITAG